MRAHLGRGNLDQGYRIPKGKGLTWAAATTKRPVYAPDVRKDPRYLAKVETTLSEVAIPLMVRDEVVGVLDFQSEQIDYFDSEMIDLLTLFSTQASLALENARLYSTERRRTKQLEAINAVAKKTTRVLDLDELLTVVCRLLMDLFGIDHAAVLLAEGDHRFRTLNTQAGLQRSGGVIHTRVNYAAVVATLVSCEDRLFLDQQQSKLRQKAGCMHRSRETYDSSANDNNVEALVRHSSAQDGQPRAKLFIHGWLS